MNKRSFLPCEAACFILKYCDNTHRPRSRTCLHSDAKGFNEWKKKSCKSFTTQCTLRQRVTMVYASYLQIGTGACLTVWITQNDVQSWNLAQRADSLNTFVCFVTERYIERCSWTANKAARWTLWCGNRTSKNREASREYRVDIDSLKIWESVVHIRNMANYSVVGCRDAPYRPARPYLVTAMNIVTYS